ncbi:FRG domain-containing protein [Aliivibrio fischeri]|uniref:FRG domain-containing protein n=1 Tax=Aliivibrio fischeri TaxID=668 RepID=UPI00080E52A0|nr:FRG domain-containing protein [Aliivibrio fischeri]OCH22526.1 FRG domain-containing protein [Aliivibrio fischeri]
MKKVEVNSISEYVSHIETLSGIQDYWFRGVSEEAFAPLPGLYWRNVSEDEGSLEHDFLVSYKAYVTHDNYTPWDIFTLMQHHGLPTRLLDWSESALVGLFFALTTNPDSEKARIVWVMKPHQLNSSNFVEAAIYCPAEMASTQIFRGVEESVYLNAYLPPNLTPEEHLYLPEKPIAINATRGHKRVSSQKGCFTVHGSEKKPINEYFNDEDAFYKVEININSNEHRLNMIESLAGLGIDEEFIYQDLDSLCRRIMRQRLS